MSSTAGRVPPLPPEEFPERERQAEGWWKELAFSQVLLRHPKLYRTFIPHMATLVNGGSLPPRDRQIVILRTLELCGDTYEMGHHRVMSRTAGLGDAEIEAIVTGGGDVLGEHDLVLVHAAEELVQDRCLSDGTWSALGETYALEQRMEVVYLAGCFQTVAMLTTTFGIEAEPDVERFEELRNQQER